MARTVSVGQDPKANGNGLLPSAAGDPGAQRP